MAPAWERGADSQPSAMEKQAWEKISWGQALHSYLIDGKVEVQREKRQIGG